MCIRKYVHHLSCDARPLFTTTLDDRFHEVFVDPYSPPLPCNPNICKADECLPPLPASEQCPSHPCCWLAVRDILCSSLSSQMAVAGRAYLIPPQPRVDECPLFSNFHVYLQDDGRRAAASPAPPAWVKAMYPDPHLVERSPRRSDVPMPAYDFILARRNLLLAGQRLLVAKQTLNQVKALWMTVRQQRAQQDEVVPDSTTVDFADNCYRLAYAAGKMCQEAWDDCACMLSRMEARGLGCLHLLALRADTGLNVALGGGSWARVEYSSQLGYFVGTYVCQRHDCENPASIPREFPFSLGYRNEDVGIQRPLM